MSIEMRRLALRLRQPALGMLLLGTLSACERNDDGERDHVLQSPAVQRLVGAWDVSFTSDPHASLRAPPTTRVLSGTLAFTVDRYGPSETAELSGITNEGTYDIDFEPFGWTTRAADAPAVAVARVAARLRPVDDLVSDSLVVVLSPGSERLAVVMSGTFSGDSAAGLWSAYGYRAGGGTGRFVMRRHATSP
jgi:hypothetical protein